MDAAAVRALALAQVMPWTGFSLRDPARAADLLLFVERVRFAFLLVIRDGQVTIAEKPGLFPPDEIRGLVPTANRGLWRAHLYRRFIARIVARHGFDREVHLVLAMRDLIGTEPALPVFAFQKTRGSRVLLLPDIDFLRHDFYRDTSFADARDFEAKLDKAIFVGATSGLPRISLEDVRERRLPRLRSALHFRGSPEVDYLLPRIVGCDGPDTEAAIRALGLGDREYAWNEMFAYRFMLSADGNGATCERVVAALQSNSVLVKYASEHRLYYFDAMVPWRHYIPVQDDEEVTKVLALCRQFPDLAPRIAADGKAFYRDHIGPEAVEAYMLELLRLYAEICGPMAPTPTPGLRG